MKRIEFALLLFLFILPIFGQLNCVFSCQELCEKKQIVGRKKCVRNCLYVCKQNSTLNGTFPEEQEVTTSSQLLKNRKEPVNVDSNVLQEPRKISLEMKSPSSEADPFYYHPKETPQINEKNIETLEKSSQTSCSLSCSDQCIKKEMTSVNEFIHCLRVCPCPKSKVEMFLEKSKLSRVSFTFLIFICVVLGVIISGLYSWKHLVFAKFQRRYEESEVQNYYQTLV